MRACHLVFKETVCNNRPGFSCSSGIKSIRTILRYETETYPSNAYIFVKTLSLFEFPVKSYDFLFGLLILGN